MVSNKKKSKQFNSKYNELYSFINKIKINKKKYNWKVNIHGGNNLNGFKLVLENEGTFGIGKSFFFNELKKFGYNKLLKRIDCLLLFEYCFNFRYLFRKFVFVKNKFFFNNYLKLMLNNIHYYRTSLIMYNYRGMRLIKGLPVRGQRTRTNNKTSKKKQNRIFKI